MAEKSFDVFVQNLYSIWGPVVMYVCPTKRTVGVCCTGVYAFCLSAAAVYILCLNALIG